jgi:hypothetical protein
LPTGRRRQLNIESLFVMQRLIDKYLPEYSFRERHEKKIDAGAEACFLAVLNLDMRQSFITRLLVRLRGLPSEYLSLEGFILAECFRYVDEKRFEEFVIDASRHDIRIFWNFHFQPLSPQETLVTTETRILCLHTSTRRRFKVYWFFIRPFSGWIRLEILRILRKKLSPKKTG